MAIHTLTGEVGRALPVLMLDPWDILGTSGSLLGGRASCPPSPTYQVPCALSLPEPGEHTLF